MPQKIVVLNRFFPVFIWCGVIFFLSAQPTLPSASKFLLDYFLKKSAHIIEYAILFLLTIRSVRQHNKNTLMVFLFCFFYALSDEFHQRFVPGRHSNIFDVYFDSVGMLIAFLRTKHLI